MEKNIILIGFMATGKTAVGQALSKKLKLKYLSTDTLIEKKAKKKIKTIFAAKGEDHFRDLETKVLKGLSGNKQSVISCGGGIILRKENRSLLKKLGKVVLLTASADTINKRLKTLGQRPLLNIKNEDERKKAILKKLKERKPFYLETASTVIDTSKLDLKEVVQRIVEEL